jgi:hypothetical protein
MEKSKKRKIGTPVNRRQRVRARLLLHRRKRENGNRTTHVNEESQEEIEGLWV